MMKETIGFIGVGIMGVPMTKNLLKAGYKVKAYDIRPEPVERLAAQGAVGCKSIKEVCTGVEVVITMLPDSPDVEKVYLGEGGVIESASPGTILADMSTISPVSAIKVAEAAVEKGCMMLDAPVSGGDVGAREGKLSIMVGGEKYVLDRMMPIFDVLGTATLCGASGAGQIVKACNQIQVALNFIGMAEALVLGAKAGVDPAVIVKVLSGGYAQTRVMDVRGPRIVERDFAPGFKSKFHYKDLNIIRETGRAYNVPLPAAALAHELFSSMVAKGRGDLDHSGVITILEDLAEVEVRKKD
jgi:2-hydroxy-3-oxopropionate reductase